MRFEEYGQIRSADRPVMCLMQAKVLPSQIGGRNRAFEGTDVARGPLTDSALLILFDMRAVELPVESAAAA